MTPLSVACQKGFLAVVEHLILGKADVNTPKEVCSIFIAHDHDKNLSMVLTYFATYHLGM